LSWLQIGLSKSGNLWLYHILQKTRLAAGLPSKSFIQDQPIYPIAETWDLSFPEQASIDTLVINPTQSLYRISSIFQMPIEDIDAYIRQTSHVWTHSFFGPLSAKIYPKFEKLVYITRDPRDVAISLSRFAFTAYRLKHFPSGAKNPHDFLEKNLIETLKQWAGHVGGHLLEKERFNIHFVFYENLMSNFSKEYDDLLKYLGIRLNASQREQIEKEVHFETMKVERSQHLRKGRSGQWSEILSRTQCRKAEKIAGPLLDLLNYPDPRIPKKVDAKKIKLSLNRAASAALFEKARRRFIAR
jgi:aryl sulfotransferase